MRVTERSETLVSHKRKQCHGKEMNQRGSHIRKRKDGRWEGRYTAGHDPETSRAIYKNVHCGGLNGRVVQKLCKDQGPPILPPDLPGYINNHIKPNIGKVSLEKPTSLEFQKLYKKLLTSGRIDKFESKKQAEGCALPKPEHKKMKTLPVKQQTFFLREAKDSRVFEMYYVKLVTGLRRGKLLGLKWEDIDLERSNLRVKRQIARVNGEVAEAPLKTKNAYRTLPLAGPSPRTVSCIRSTGCWSGRD